MGGIQMWAPGADRGGEGRRRISGGTQRSTVRS
jgi:hypothetical protein